MVYALSPKDYDGPTVASKKNELNTKLKLKAKTSGALVETEERAIMAKQKKGPGLQWARTAAAGARTVATRETRKTLWRVTSVLCLHARATPSLCGITRHARNARTNG